MRAVAYVRVSSEEQVQGTSLDSQFKECLRYAEHQGIELREEDVFREEGVSAKIIDRPELAHLLDFCAKNKGKIHQCIVWKVDRLARNASYHQIIKSKLASYGVKLVSVTEPIDDDPTGTLMENILAAFAQFDNDIRTARTTAGMKARTEQGGWPHSAPFGYRKARMPSGIVSLAPDPETAPLVKALLETFATGNYTIEGCLAVAYKLGIRDKHDKPRGWQSMKNLLINPLYAGIVQSKFTDGRKIQGLHEAIISERTHYQIVNIVNGNTHNFTRYAEADWPLRGGFMKHTCGNILTGSAPRGRNGPSPRYHCTYCKAASGKSVSKRREIVHDEFLDLLRSIRLNGDVQALFKDIVLNRWNNEYKDLLEHNKRVQNELQLCEEKRSRILDLFIATQITKEQKDKMLVDVDKQAAQLHIQHLDDDSAIQNKEQIIDNALLFMSDPDLFWNLGDIETKRRMQAVIFPEGLTYDFEQGFGTAKLAETYQLIKKIPHRNGEELTLVATSGLEPLTSGL